MSPALRPYQAEAVDAALKALAEKKNSLLVMPTGSGKSLVISELASRIDGNVVVLQPTKEILEQNFRKAYEFGRRDIGIWSASMNARKKSRLTFATIGTIISDKDLFRDCAAVLVDEAHLVNPKAGRYAELIEHLGVPVVGPTATPYRMHRTADRQIMAKFLHQTRPRIFNRVAHVVQNRDLHAQGYLCPVIYQENPDYRPAEIALKTTGINYDEDALRKYNELHAIPQKIASTILENYNWIEHFLVFAAFVDESKEIAAAMDHAGLSCAHIDGTTPKGEREKILRRFRSGQIKVVVNVGVLTTGFDFPELDGIILGRPTLSLPLYYQMAGRGVRTAEGKQCCWLFDLCGNVERFGKPDTWFIEDHAGQLRLVDAGKGGLTERDFVTGADTFAQKIAARELRRTATEQGRTGILTVTFGKHKGKPMNALPTDYVEWCAGNFEAGQWKKAMIAELERRKIGA